MKNKDNVRDIKTFKAKSGTTECIFTVSFFKKPRSEYSYKVEKNKKITNDIVIHCLSKVFGDVLAYSGDPTLIQEAIESVAGRFYDTEFNGDED